MITGQGSNRFVTENLRYYMTRLELQLEMNNILQYSCFSLFLLSPSFIDIYKLLVTFASFLDEVHRRHFNSAGAYNDSSQNS